MCLKCPPPYIHLCTSSKASSSHLHSFPVRIRLLCGLQTATVSALTSKAIYSMRKAFLERVVVELVYKFEEKSPIFEKVCRSLKYDSKKKIGPQTYTCMDDNIDHFTLLVMRVWCACGVNIYPCIEKCNEWIDLFSMACWAHHLEIQLFQHSKYKSIYYYVFHSDGHCAYSLLRKKIIFIGLDDILIIDFWCS